MVMCLVYSTTGSDEARGQHVSYSVIGASREIRTPNQRIMRTTIALATISVCGLDYAFAMLHKAI